MHLYEEGNKINYHICVDYISIDSEATVMLINFNWSTGFMNKVFQIYLEELIRITFVFTFNGHLLR